MTVAATIAASPFKGLAPYGDSDVDALFFFGRERESEVIAANLLASRLTVLYGSTGVGKTSILRAGVVRALRTVPFRREVVVFQDWADAPAARLAAVVAAASGVTARQSLTETIADAGTALDGELYIVLDQLEEYFVYHGSSVEPGSFLAELADALTQSDVRASMLLSLRDDALARLDVLKSRVPALFSNYLRLDHLQRDAAARAITGPVERWNELFADEGHPVTVEPALVGDVLDQVTNASGGVETPYLQLVLERLWGREREQGSSVLRAATLHEVGGAPTIVGDHLIRAMDSLTPEETATAAALYLHMVTPSGTKVAHTADDLARYASVDRSIVDAVAKKLVAERVLRPVPSAKGEPRLEIFHDVLAPAVTEWRTRFEARQSELRARQEAELRHRHAVTVAAFAVVGLIVVLAFAIFALGQRSEARHHARTAHASELVARALLLQSTHPGEALRLALNASRLERNAETESVLRTSLMAFRLRRLLAVGAPVTVVSWVGNGLAAVGAGNGDVRIWNVADDRIVAARRFAGPVAAMAAIPGRDAVVVVAGGTAALWMPGAGVARLRGSNGRPALDAAVDATGTLVAVADGGGVDLRSAAKKSLLRRIPASGAMHVVFAPDGRTIAVVRHHPDGHVRLSTYDLASGALLATSPRRGIGPVAFSPDSTLVAAGSADGTVALWRPRTGEAVRTLDDGGKAIRDVAFDPAGKMLATASSDGGVRVWRVADGSRFFLFLGHTAPVSRVAFSPDGTYLASTSEDGTARIWITSGPEAGRGAAVLAGSRGGVTTAAFSPGGHSLVTGAVDGTARLWEPRVEQRLAAVRWFRGSVEAARLTRSGLVALTDGTLQIGPRDANAIPGLGNPVALSNELVAAATGREVVVRRIADRRIVAILRAPGRVTALAFDDAGDAVVAADGREVEAWTVPAGRVLGRFEIATPAERVALAPKRDIVATGDASGVVTLWTIHGTEWHVLRFHRAGVTDLRFAHDGRRLVTAAEGSVDNAATWDVATGRLVAPLVGHFGTVTAASFSPDDRWIATAGPISAAIWSASDGAQLFYLRGPTDLLTDAEWAPTGTTVVTAERDGVVRSYSCGVCGTLPQLQTLATKRLAAAR